MRSLNLFLSCKLLWVKQFVGFFTNALTTSMDPVVTYFTLQCFTLFLPSLVHLLLQYWHVSPGNYITLLRISLDGDTSSCEYITDVNGFELAFSLRLKKTFSPSFIVQNSNKLFHHPTQLSALPSIPQHSSSTPSQDYQVSTDLYHYSFFPRAIPEWNKTISLYISNINDMTLEQLYSLPCTLACYLYRGFANYYNNNQDSRQ